MGGARDNTLLKKRIILQKNLEYGINRRTSNKLGVYTVGARHGGTSR